MVEKTYHKISPYLGTFKAYLMPQSPIYGSIGVFIYKNDRWNVAINSRYLHLVKKPLVLVKNDPNRLIWLRKLAKV